MNDIEGFQIEPWRAQCYTNSLMAVDLLAADTKYRGYPIICTQYTYLDDNAVMYSAVFVPGGDALYQGCHLPSLPEALQQVKQLVDDHILQKEGV